VRVVGLYRLLVPARWRKVIGVVMLLAFLYVAPFRDAVIAQIAHRAQNKAEQMSKQLRDQVDRMTSTTTTSTAVVP
jgi:hypothetical protein